MARKVKRPLRPMRDLNPRQQKERRLARKLGFRDEYRYRQWILRQSRLPHDDITYFDRRLVGEARVAEIQRLKRIQKHQRTPAKSVVWKYNKLVKDLDKLSPFAFQVRYEEQIRLLLKDPNTNQYERRLLRNIQKDVQKQVSTPEALKPGEQGRLF